MQFRHDSLFYGDCLDVMRAWPAACEDTGSAYPHCDPTASRYLKVGMDAVFGPANFRNEIVWRIGWVSGFKS